MKIAIHQPNLIPWFPFFYKMAMVDVFVLMNSVQFEKGGYQNRFQYKDKWITKPVKRGLKLIKDKEYVGDISLSTLNGQWIRCLTLTLNIKTRILTDSLYSPHPDDPTERIISIIKSNTRGYKDITYVTNPKAFDKYLDETLLFKAGINWEPCVVPKHLQRPTFEIIEEYGIEGAIKQLPKKEELCMKM